jgi:hypothetical protein
MQGVPPFQTMPSIMFSDIELESPVRMILANGTS